MCRDLPRHGERLSGTTLETSHPVDVRRIRNDPSSRFLRRRVRRSVPTGRRRCGGRSSTIRGQLGFQSTTLETDPTSGPRAGSKRGRPARVKPNEAPVVRDESSRHHPGYTSSVARSRNAGRSEARMRPRTDTEPRSPNPHPARRRRIRRTSAPIGHTGPSYAEDEGKPRFEQRGRPFRTTRTHTRSTRRHPAGRHSACSLLR